MKLILVILSLMIMACGGPTVELKRKFKKGEIVLIEGKKYIVDYSYQSGNSILYSVDPLENGPSLDINENSISKYVKDESQSEVDSSYITESDTIAY